jgi:IS1 family transposase/transposase-like protein
MVVSANRILKEDHHMIQKIVTFVCPRCGSDNLVKNGHNKVASQQAHCKDCGAYFVLEPKKPHGSETRKILVKTALERCSLRGLERIFEVARQTAANWIAAFIRALPPFRKSILPAQPDDILEIDEVWSFVRCKAQQRWLWTVMCRRTRQIIAYVIGDHSDETCQRLWQRLPADYRRCHSYSDFWGAYQRVLPSATHQCVGKETGETAHIERWYNTLRQRLARYVRKTLSFSKSDKFHHLFTKWFIFEYNLACGSQ